MAVPIAYLYWYSRIKDWKGKEVKEKEFRSCFFQWRIPKNLRYLIVKEMQKMGLVKIENRTVYLLDSVFFEEKGKEEDYKDGDTKVKSPYLPLNLL
jgi:hypothetical protein